MAGVRNMMRLAPRAPLLRPTSAFRRAPNALRTYASASTRPIAEPQAAPDADESSDDHAALEDPNMNGNYPDPSLTSALPVKRQFRDPYADWWDKQERRNYGEPLHEDNDILGIFSPDEYTHFTPGWGLVLWGCFLTAVGGLCAGVYYTYPDLPSAPRTYEDGLEAELGGPGAAHARKSDGERAPLDRF